MISRKQFDSVKKELKHFAKKREEIIKNSRDIISISKQIIYGIHRNEINKVNPLIKKIKAKVKSIPKERFDTDINRIALQEYVEAIAYHHFVKTKKLISKAALKVDAESYLLGLADLSGELVRRAGSEIIRRNYKEAEKIKRFVNLLYGEFLRLELRGSELRKKADALRWNLKKLEETMLDFTMAIRRR